MNLRGMIDLIAKLESGVNLMLPEAKIRRSLSEVPQQQDLLKMRSDLTTSLDKKRENLRELTDLKAKLIKHPAYLRYLELKGQADCLSQWCDELELVLNPTADDVSGFANGVTGSLDIEDLEYQKVEINILGQRDRDHLNAELVAARSHLRELQSNMDQQLDQEWEEHPRAA